MKYPIIFLLILSSFCIICCEGGAVISPPGIAPVCSGDTLNLTCTTTGRFQEWSFTLIPENETAPMRYTRSLQTYGPKHLQIFEQVIASTMFLYSRNSAENSLPLMSTLSVSPVSAGLNGTVVNCTDITTSDTVSTIIFIIESSPQQEINVTLQLVMLESDGVIITLRWTGDRVHYLSHYYHIKVIPPIHPTELNFTGRMSIQLKVSYDIKYNVTVVAVPLCGQSNVIMTTSTELIYYKCKDPIAQVQDFVKVIGYTEPALEGLNITFMCPMRYLLIGTNTSTCTGNGEWEPDPREAECVEHVIQVNQPYDIKKAITLSSVSTFLVTALTVFIIGCTFGYCLSQRCMKKVNKSHTSQITDIELEENVAYSVTVP